MARMYIDCREMPSDSGCDLTISGSENHVLDAAVIHAVTAHGHENSPELREQIRSGLKAESAGIHA